MEEVAWVTRREELQVVLILQGLDFRSELQALHDQYYFSSRNCSNGSLLPSLLLGQRLKHPPHPLSGVINWSLLGISSPLLTGTSLWCLSVTYLSAWHSWPEAAIFSWHFLVQL